jgi:hypothetical protein
MWHNINVVFLIKGFNLSFATYKTDKVLCSGYVWVIFYHKSFYTVPVCMYRYIIWNIWKSFLIYTLAYSLKLLSRTYKTYGCEYGCRPIKTKVSNLKFFFVKFFYPLSKIYSLGTLYVCTYSYFSPIQIFINSKLIDTYSTVFKRKLETFPI